MWIPLASARLRPDGIEPSAETTAALNRLAAAVGRELAARQARAAATRRARENLVRPLARPPVIESADPRKENYQFLSEHEAFRYDAFPPWTDPDTWWYLCDGCGDECTREDYDVNAKRWLAYERAHHERPVLAETPAA